MQLTDTDVGAETVYVASYAGLSGPERVERAVEMAEGAKAVAIAGIRFRQPQLTDPDVHREWLRLLHGDALVRVLLPYAI